MKNKIMIWLIIIILLMGLAFWLFFPRTKRNEPVAEEDIVDSVIVVDSNVNVYVKPGVKNITGSQAFLEEHLKYSLNFKAYLDSSFNNPIWFYVDDINHSRSFLKTPTETFGAKIYYSEDSINYTLLSDWYYDFNSEYSLFLPGVDGDVLLLKFNNFTGSAINLWNKFSYSPAHFGELFDVYIRQDFAEDSSVETSTNKYDLSKYFTTYVKNEDSLYEEFDNKLIFNFNFRKVDSLDEISKDVAYDETLLNFSQKEMNLSLNKETGFLTWNAVDGADYFVVKDNTIIPNKTTFVANSDINSFDLRNVFKMMSYYPNFTKELYVFGVKEILDVDESYYKTEKTLNSNLIPLIFNWFSSNNLNYLLNELGFVEYDSFNNCLRYISSGVYGWDLIDKTYEFYINGQKVATTPNSILYLDNVDFTQDLENGVNSVEVKVISDDLVFSSDTNNVYMIDENGISATCEFPLLNDRFVGKPTDLSFDNNNILTWTGVSWAQNYTVVIHGLDTVILPASEITFDFSSYIEDMQPGDTQISVYAMLDGWQINAAGFDFVYNHYSYVKFRNGDVEVPTNLFFGHPYNSSAWTLTWNGLDPQIADYYEIKIEDYILTSNSKLYNVNKFTINLSNQNLVLSGGNHNVCVRAVIGENFSDWSESILLPVLGSVSDVHYDDETKQLTFKTPFVELIEGFSWSLTITDSNSNVSYLSVLGDRYDNTVAPGDFAICDLSSFTSGAYTIEFFIVGSTPERQTQILITKNNLPIEITIG